VNELEPKPDWQPTRTQLAKWHFKNTLGTAALLGIACLGVLLYVGLLAAVFHFLHWR
jgi:hypothetical protein